MYRCYKSILRLELLSIKPERFISVSEAYYEEEDTLQQFIDEKCSVGDEVGVGVGVVEFYNQYCDFLVNVMKISHDEIPSKRWVSKQMRTKKFKKKSIIVKGKKVKCWGSIQINEENVIFFR